MIESLSETETLLNLLLESMNTPSWVEATELGDTPSETTGTKLVELLSPSMILGIGGAELAVTSLERRWVGGSKIGFLVGPCWLWEGGGEKMEL